ncbi:MAG: hypothetical protein SGJ00_14615 [bacterium]|nr:hypothetical protein [bacterium]
MNLKFGLIGHPLHNQFSVNYFTRNFEEAGLAYSYENFDLATEEELRAFISALKTLGDPYLGGHNLNVPNNDGITLQGSEIGGTNLEGQSLHGQSLHEQRLHGHSLEEQHLEGQSLEEQRLEGQRLHGQRLHEQSLEEQSLEGHSLEGHSLEGQSLGGSNFVGASFGGLNVTKPYKEKVLSMMDELSIEAEVCGAVNCIQFLPNGVLKGHNTDVYGFNISLQQFLGLDRKKRALIFGNGGAAKAVCYVLNELSIPYHLVTRSLIKQENELNYSELTLALIKQHELLINASSVGMYPNEDQCLPIPFEGIGKAHFCYDLIYLPEKTTFLLEAEKRGARVKNGLDMLHLQADEAYRIWMDA